jgi:hypothetical protein
MKDGIMEKIESGVNALVGGTPISVGGFSLAQETNGEGHSAHVEIFSGESGGSAPFSVYGPVDGMVSLLRRILEKLAGEVLIPKARDGSECPNCGSTDIHGGSVDIESPNAIQKMLCLSCDATWIDVYALVDYTDLEVE